MQTVLALSNDALTIFFPSTVRRVGEGVLELNRSLRSVILNEGLERLGECKDETACQKCVFRENPHLKSIALPSTLRVLGNHTFLGCSGLKHVTFAKNA